MLISSKTYSNLLVTFAGILFTLAFAPFDQPYLAPVALSLLFTCWQKTTPKQAFFRGYLFGLGSFGVGVSWVYISIHDFGGANPLSSSLMTCLFFGFWALFPALVGYISVSIRRDDQGLKGILVMPVVWQLFEYFRGAWVLDGFPWLQSAYSQIDMPLGGYIPVLGVYGTGFLVALTASTGAFIFQNKKHWPFLCLLLIAIWTGGSLLKTIKWTHPLGNPINVSLIQGNISQDQKWLPENKLKTLMLYKELTEENWTSSVIVWPETSIPAYLADVHEGFLLPLSRAAEQHKTDLIVSLPAYDELTNEKYNTVMTLGKDRALYRKKHLLPFGEYLPWQPVSGFILNSLGIKLGNFTPGNKNQALLKAGGYSFITSICYEDVFGDLSITDLSEAAYLVNVTNDGWFGHSIEPYQHLQMARMRALETGRFMLRATNTGATAVIGPKGEIIKQAPLFKTTVLNESIIPMIGITPYARFGDLPSLIVLLILLFSLIFYTQPKVIRNL